MEELNEETSQIQVENGDALYTASCIIRGCTIYIQETFIVT